MNDLQPFRPWAPKPLPKPPGMAKLVWLLARNPLLVWSEAHYDLPVLYGENRYRRVISLQDPEAIQRVLIDNVGGYIKGPIQRRILGPLLGDGLLTTEGEPWRRTRRTVAPLFTPRRVAAQAGQMAAAVDRTLTQWRTLPSGAVVDLEQAMSRLTFDILSETLFSGEIGEDAAAFERTLNTAVSTLGRPDPLDVLGAPGWLPRPTRVAGMPSVRRFGRLVQGIIAARRARVAADPASAPDDLLTALLRAQDPETGAGLSDAEVQSNVLTFILAGHETTARALGWTLYLLSRAPDVRAEVEREADAGEDPAGDWPEARPWTRAALEESMRLFPPAAGFTRQATADDVLAGQPIRAGTVVLITPWVIHRHRRLWDDPAAFRPERFLPGAREAIDRHAYLPFGGGPRICIGARFALLEAVIALSLIAREVRLTPATAREPRPVHHVTLRSDRGLPMRLERRPGA